MANYNNADFIRKAIESVIEQTFEDWELIIVDDDLMSRGGESARLLIFSRLSQTPRCTPTGSVRGS